MLRALALILIIPHAAITLRLLIPADTGREARPLYDASVRIRHGLPTYDPVPPPGPHRIEVPGLYLYSPQVAAAVAVLPEVSWSVYRRLLIGLLVVVFYTNAALLSHVALKRWSVRGTLVTATVLLAIPTTLVHYGMGQASVVEWLALTATVALPSVAGTGLSVSALLKIHGVWIGVAALFRRDWRTIKQALAFTAVAFLLAAVVMTPSRMLHDTLVWVRDVLPTLGQGEVGGFSLVGLPFRKHTNPGVLPAWMRLYLLVMFALGPIVTAWFARRLSREWHYGLTIAASLLFAPLFRPSYLVSLAPVFALIYERRTRPSRRAACSA